MTKAKIFATAAILASTLAGPAMAQEVIYNPGYCAQFYPNANCQNMGPGNRYTGSYPRQVYADQVYRDQAYRDRTWQNSYNRWDNNDWRYRRGPDDVAAGVVGGAIGTAGAIATAPFAAYDNGQSYAQRNGLVCTPGTWFRGEDGRRHLCQ